VWSTYQGLDFETGRELVSTLLPKIQRRMTEGLHLHLVTCHLPPVTRQRTLASTMSSGFATGKVLVADFWAYETSLILDNLP
jgi:hypothetical protein